jgi:hypothetical protein
MSYRVERGLHTNTGSVFEHSREASCCDTTKKVLIIAALILGAFLICTAIASGFGASWGIVAAFTGLPALAAHTSMAGAAVVYLLIGGILGGIGAYALSSKKGNLKRPEGRSPIQEESRTTGGAPETSFTIERPVKHEKHTSPKSLETYKKLMKEKERIKKLKQANKNRKEGCSSKEDIDEEIGDYNAKVKKFDKNHKDFYKKYRDKDLLRPIKPFEIHEKTARRRQSISSDSGEPVDSD